MFDFSFSKRAQAKPNTDDAAVQFVFLMIEYAKESFGTLRVKEILRSAFSLREEKVHYGSDGFPIFEEGGDEALKVAVIGLSNELIRAFGTSFVESLFERAIRQLELRFTPEVIDTRVMPVVPGGFLELRKIRTLSKEELESAVAKKTREIQTVNTSLEQKVAERTGRLNELLADQERAAQLLVRRDLELTRANDRLRKLDEIKSSFISVVAHQLRTPLSGIKWTLNLLINGDMGELGTEQKTFLMKAYESNDRMISLVNDMLGADRIDSGKVRYAFQPVQLSDVIDNVLFELLPQANAKGLTIRFGPKPPSFLKVHADPERLRAVFQNLLENSVKYSRPQGAIEISITPEDHEAVEVSIKDDGIGIPKDQQKNIFDRFFRAQNAINLETDGSGLGLFIVKSIVERHGGRIWFESEEGRGVTFHFTIPVDRSEATGKPPADEKGVDGL